MSSDSSDPAVLEVSQAETTSDRSGDKSQTAISTPESFESKNISSCNSNGTQSYAEDGASPFEQDLKGVVDDPQKQHGSFETYISYRVTTVTNRTAEFANDKYVVRRRYSDFLWLRNKLVKKFPTRLIPPLPNKHGLLEQFDRYSREFINFRLMMLNKFLNRAVKHPVLTHSEDLNIFLTATSAEFSAHQKGSGSILDKVSDGIFSLSLAHSTREKCSDFDDVRIYINNFSEKLSSFEKIMFRILKERRDLIFEMQQLSAEFDRWSSYEPVLSSHLQSVMTALNVSAGNHRQYLVDPMESTIFQPVKEYLLYADSIRELLARRDAIQTLYVISSQEVEKVKAEKKMITDAKEEGKQHFWKAANEDKEQKLEKLTAVTPKLVFIAETNQCNLQRANEDFKVDLEQWSEEKKKDIKGLLLAMSEHHIQYYQKTVQIWEAALKKVKEPVY